MNNLLLSIIFMLISELFITNLAVFNHRTPRMKHDPLTVVEGSVDAEF